MENGFVNFYDHVKGYGFIRRERGRDVFFRYDDFLFLGHDVDICKPRFYVSTSKSIIKALINMHSFEIQLSPIG
nr:cold shock domain-containing protein [Escherichia coli]